MPVISGGAAGQVSVARKVLTNAQVLALPTTPVQLVPAAGASTILLPLFCNLRVTWVADYTNIDVGCVVSLKANVAQVTMGLLQSSGSKVSSLLAGGGPDGVTAQMLFIQTQVSGASTVLNGIAGNYDSDLANQPLNLVADNGVSGNFTGGNVGNALTVTVWYVTADF